MRHWIEREKGRVCSLRVLVRARSRARAIVWGHSASGMPGYLSRKAAQGEQRVEGIQGRRDEHVLHSMCPRHQYALLPRRPRDAQG